MAKADLLAGYALAFGLVAVVQVALVTTLSLGLLGLQIQGSVALLALVGVVDALLGTGARGEPRPPLDAVIDQLNAAAAPKLAIDLPSGLDCDAGTAARHTIRAAQTCTFVAAKPGFFAPGAEQYVGRLHVLDIGAPRQVIEKVLDQKV